MPRTPARRGARLRAMVRPVVALPGGAVRVCWALVIVLSYATAVAAQAPDGSRVFQASCASCHTGAADSRAPAVDALRARTPQAIIDALLIGAMRPQGSRLSGAERRAVAEFITGKSSRGRRQRCVRRTLHGAHVAAGLHEVAALDRMEPIDHQLALSIGRAGRSRRIGFTATEVEMGIRIP